ncbi:hypothetical protein [Sphingosinicella terrae]|uniref:hypothetical protein n=1 Tax=Sphingosinicella terrae TaxID=2172047 RepID=UPI0013B3D797|nr:hypothetical protein [Sphingosinicella terrae]
MSSQDGDYYQKRAEQEVELAQRSTDPVAVQFHYAMTELYLEKLHGGASPAPRPGGAGQ